MHTPESLFVHLEGFSFTEDEFEDQDFWYDNLGLNIFPLHGIEEFNPEDESNVLTTSLQDFTWKSKKGVYRHRPLFNWAMSYHILVNELASSKLFAIYATNYMLRAVNKNGIITGFELSAFEPEPFMFSQKNQAGNSEIFIEHADSDELNTYGYQVEVDWPVKKMDRLPVTIELSFSQASIYMTVKYLGTLVSGITASEITIYDKVNGYINFSTFVPSGGYYTLSNFDNIITSAIIFVKSRLYIGCKAFKYTYTLKEGVGFLLMTGDNFLLMNDTNFLLMDEKLPVTIVYGGFVDLGGGRREMYIRVLDVNDNPVEDVDIADFSATSGNPSNITYFNNGVYSWPSTFEDTGTITINGELYIGNVSWDITELFFEANMEAMYLMRSNPVAYAPPFRQIDLTGSEIMTNPDSEKWNIVVNGRQTDMYLGDLPAGESFDLIVDVEAITVDGSGYMRVINGTTVLVTITTSGISTTTFTVTSQDLYFEYNNVIDILINSIKITIN
jgi:hypothetical protein